MDLDKLPRWALGIICTTAIGLSWISIGFVVKNAFADIESVKSVSLEAKHISETNTKDIMDLKDSIKGIYLSSETFRREYRDDQKDLDKKLGELLRAVRA